MSPFLIALGMSVAATQSVEKPQVRTVALVAVDSSRIMDEFSRVCLRPNLDVPLTLRAVNDSDLEYGEEPADHAQFPLSYRWQSKKAALALEGWTDNRIVGQCELEMADRQPVMVRDVLAKLRSLIETSIRQPVQPIETKYGPQLTWKTGTDIYCLELDGKANQPTQFLSIVYTRWAGFTKRVCGGELPQVN
jgi:hypothetical protein